MAQVGQQMHQNYNIKWMIGLEFTRMKVNSCKFILGESTCIHYIDIFFLIHNYKGVKIIRETKCIILK